MDIRRAAIVGAGPGGLLGFIALQAAGVPAAEIDVFDPGPPLAVWRESMSAIAQRGMRSESDGHFYITDFPGLALIDTVRRRSARPLLQSAINRYHPDIDLVLDQGTALARHYGLEHRHVATHIERVSREGDHFVLRSEHGETIGRARHVLLALGHGEWRWPEVCAQQSARLELTGLLYHSYQPKQYPADTVVVVGAGMAAMNEWVNVLRHGGRLIVVHRGRRLMEQALSAPRCSFSGPWLDRYHQMSPEDRGEVLSALSRGTVPRSGRRIIRQARDEGRIQLISGEIAGIERIGDRVSMNVRELGSGHLETIEGAMMIAATGFQSSWEDIPILRDLVEEQGVTVCGTLLKLEDDCSVPVVSQLESSVALSGPLSRWAYPPADSLAGMKYAGRRFAARVTGSNGPTVPAWWRMVRAGWARSGPQQDGESCASR